MAVLYNFFFAGRRLILIAITITLQQYSILQIILYIFTSILNSIYLVYYRPFESRYQNYLELFNELCVSSAGYLLFVFTEWIESDDIQVNAGIALVGVLLLNFMTNIFFMIGSTALSLRDLYRRRKWYMAYLRI